MLTIELSNLKFYGYHGLYEEEKILGNGYDVNISVTFQPKSLPIDKISQTIDYTTVYRLIKHKMSIPTPLLETIATSFAKEILSVFEQAAEVSISIKKINPPIVLFEGNAGVKFILKREQVTDL